MSEEPVYRILLPAEWQESEEAGEVLPTTIDEHDGFLHLSPASKLFETANRYFQEETELVLLRFDPTALGPALHWEPVAARGGLQFPHYYARLPLEQVLEVIRLRRSHPSEPWGRGTLASN